MLKKNCVLPYGNPMTVEIASTCTVKHRCLNRIGKWNRFHGGELEMKNCKRFCKYHQARCRRI